MAVSQINQSLDTNTASMKTEVFMKKKWGGKWVHRPNFQVLNINQFAAPAMSTASILIRYGKGSWEDLSQITNATSLESFNRVYVQIRGHVNAEELILFTGVIPAEKFQLLGEHGGIRTANQVISAEGLDSILESRLEFGTVLRGAATQKRIGFLPVFNQRHQYGGKVLGNRCDYSIGVDRGDGTMINIYIFGGEEVWNNFQIIQYLLTCYQENNGPKFQISENSDIIEALREVVGVYDFSTMTLRGALNSLINRARGLSWKYKINENGTIEIVPFSMLDSEIKIGDVTMPANSDRIDIENDLWSDKVAVKTEITADSSPVYDRIVVRGAKMKCCFTVKYSDGTLEKGWTDDGEYSEETLYKEAAKYTTGYADLSDSEKALINDTCRAADKYSKVFTTFRIPPDWNWKIGTKIVNPYINNKGEIDLDQQGVYYNKDKRILPSLPFIEGVDYSEEQPPDKNKADSEPDYRRVFVLVKDDNGRYNYVEKRSPGGHVRTLDREMGIEVKFNPQYLAAKNRFDTAEPSDTNVEIGIDYEELLATVFIETDNYFSAAHELSVSENQKTLIIDVPDAELWYVVPGTIVDIDELGKLVTFKPDDGIIRNDIDKIKSVLDSAVAWYGHQHNKAVITFEDTVLGFEIGTLITGIGVAGESAGSVVTSRLWDFENNVPKTEIKTDHAELDIATEAYGFSSGTVSTPGFKTASRKIDQISYAMADFRAQINKAPARQANGGGGVETETEAAMAVCVIVESPIAPTPEDPTGQNYYILRLINDATNQYSVDTTYHLGDLVIDFDTNFMYESILEAVGETPDDNLGNALTDTNYWSRKEEIKVSQIFGYSTDYDVRDFMPIIEKDTAVRYFKYAYQGEPAANYIDFSFFYVGSAQYRTLTMVKNEADEVVVGAVFA